MTFFFCINQDLFDGSAHALYCYRHCCAMAAARPEKRVVLLHCGDSPDDGRFGVEAPPNLEVRRVFSIRRRKGRRGVTLNFVFYWALAAYLRRHLRDGDVVSTAGFLKLAAYLFEPKRFRQRIVRLYDSHQDMSLEYGPESKQARLESRVFSQADLLLTTTEVMLASMRRRFPSANCLRLGLGCGYSPESFAPVSVRAPGPPFTLGYVGSFYAGQGVDWLVRAWTMLPASLSAVCRLELVGGSESEVLKIQRLVESAGLSNVTVRGRVGAAEIPSVVAGMDALVIPSLPEGRMPYVAITKSYDYLAMRRPLLVADLPSITEVVRPGPDGVAFRAGDAADFSQGLAALFENLELRMQLVAGATLRASAFTWSSRSQAIWSEIALIANG